MSAADTTVSDEIAQLRVRQGGGGWRHDARSVGVVWRRELIAFWRNRTRILIAFIQPLLYLFVLGTGLSVVIPSPGDFNYRTFMFPGVLALAVLFPSLFSAGTIVFDREFGFMREMLVAPIRRGTIVVGKCLGGATVAALQGSLLLVFAGLVGVPYDVVLFAQLILMLLLLSFALVAFGVMAAARVQSFQSFQAVLQIAVFPMLFLSGAMFPLHGLPTWLQVLTRLDPITYAVDPMRRAVFAHLDVPQELRNDLDPGVTWFGWHVPTALELLIVLLMGLVMLGIGIKRFRALD